MLRICFLQIWFNLSDPDAEEAIYDSESMRRFARIELSEDKVPDETSVLNFRHLLEEHDLTKAMFDTINGLMEGKALLLRSGTIVDATIIAAPSSTKNGTESRGPEIKETKKGNNWHFGMKVHVGTDKRGVVHSLTATHAAAADITQMNMLLHGEERTIFRSGVLEGGGPPAVPRRWCSLTGESARYGTAAADGLSEEDQPESIEKPYARRTRLPHREAAPGIHEGAISRNRQERRSRTRLVRAGKSVVSLNGPRNGPIVPIRGAEPLQETFIYSQGEFS
jgi:IS5 family transposase